MPENIDALLESLDSQMDEILKIENLSEKSISVVFEKSQNYGFLPESV